MVTICSAARSTKLSFAVDIATGRSIDTSDRRTSGDLGPVALVDVVVGDTRLEPDRRGRGARSARPRRAARSAVATGRSPIVIVTTPVAGSRSASRSSRRRRHPRAAWRSGSCRTRGPAARGAGRRGSRRRRSRSRAGACRPSTSPGTARSRRRIPRCCRSACGHDGTVFIHGVDAGDESEWRAFLAAHPFGELVAGGGPRAAGAGRRADAVRARRRRRARSTCSARNPVWDAIAENPAVVLAVSGDWAFVPSSWKAIGDEDPRLGIPTTYYASVQLTGDVTVIDDPDGIAAVLRTQLAALQPDEDVVDPSEHAARLRVIRALRHRASTRCAPSSSTAATSTATIAPRCSHASIDRDGPGDRAAAAPPGAPHRPLTGRTSGQHVLEERAGARFLVGVGRDLERGEVGGARRREALEPGAHGGLVADERHVGRARPRPPGPSRRGTRAGRCSRRARRRSDPSPSPGSSVTHTGTLATMRGAGRPGCGRRGLERGTDLRLDGARSAQPEDRAVGAGAGELEHARPHRREHHARRGDVGRARRPPRRGRSRSRR